MENSLGVQRLMRIFGVDAKDGGDGSSFGIVASGSKGESASLQMVDVLEILSGVSRVVDTGVLFFPRITLSIFSHSKLTLFPLSPSF